MFLPSFNVRKALLSKEFFFIFYRIFFAQGADDFARYACRYDVFGNIFCYDAAACDNGIFTYRNSAVDDNTACQPYAVADLMGFAYSRS